MSMMVVALVAREVERGAWGVQAINLFSTITLMVMARDI